MNDDADFSDDSSSYQWCCCAQQLCFSVCRLLIKVYVLEYCNSCAQYDNIAIRPPLFLVSIACMIRRPSKLRPCPFSVWSLPWAVAAPARGNHAAHRLLRLLLWHCRRHGSGRAAGCRAVVGATGTGPAVHQAAGVRVAAGSVRSAQGKRVDRCNVREGGVCPRRPRRA